jgi:hypothetical protein
MTGLYSLVAYIKEAALGVIPKLDYFRLVSPDVRFPNVPAFRPKAYQFPGPARLASQYLAQLLLDRKAPSSVPFYLAWLYLMAC